MGSVAGSVGRDWAPLRVGGNSVLGSVAGSVENDQKEQSERVNELDKWSTLGTFPARNLRPTALRGRALRAGLRPTTLRGRARSDAPALSTLRCCRGYTASPVSRLNHHGLPVAGSSYASHGPTATEGDSTPSRNTR